MTWEDPDQRYNAVAALKAQYLERTKGERGTPCLSADCLHLATTRVFWPVLPGEEFPVYCDACAAWAVTVLETLGHKAHVEPLPPLPGVKRGMDIGGSL